MAIRILIADDHAIVCKGLRFLLQAEPDFDVVGEVHDGLSVWPLVIRLKPDILLMDIMMPGLNGLEIARQVHQRQPQTRVVILSMHSNEAYVYEALRGGAAGYLLKQSSEEDLVKGIREVISGQRYLSPPLSERAVEAYFEKARGQEVHDLYADLTEREREVLHLAAEGFSVAEIAARLSISPRTVETHRANLMDKLRLHTQTELVRYALRRGIVE